MNIICLFEYQLNKSRLDKSIYIAFISPSHAGNHINECEIKIAECDVEEYNIPVFKTYKEAHKFAHLHCMSEEDYNLIY